MLLGPRVTAAALMAAADGGRVALAPDARERIATARAAADAHAAGEAPVYGLNTGLGANLGHRIAPPGMAAFQVQLLRGRAVGVGPLLPERIGRAALIARLVGAARGAVGLSAPVVDLMLAMLERAVSPALPTHGSIGAGDLVLGAHMGLVLIGEGEAWQGGRVRPGAEALSAAGLAPATLAPGDALALASHSGVTVALSAAAAVRARDLVLLGLGAAALSAEGYAANPSVLDPRIHALRPGAGQERAAAWLRAALAGSSLEHAAPRAVQDALSLRTAAPVMGALWDRVAALETAVEVELNASSDSPAVLPGEPRGMRSTPNFLSPDLALALDAAAMAVAQAAGASAQRVLKLMAPGLSGLPRYLSPAGGASAGLVAMQKTAAALLAEVQRHAAPTPGAIAVSDMVEDVGAQTPLAARKLSDALDAWRWLVGVEALVAAQAVDLRAPASLGVAGRALHEAIRAAVPALGEDRATGRDVAPALAAIEAPGILDLLRAL